MILKIVLEADPIVKSMIGIQERLDTEYRKFTYTIECTVDDGYLIYNTLTCELIFVESLSSDENIFNELIKRWFYVPLRYNDYQLARRIKTLRQLVYKSEFRNNNNATVNKYWILTTTNCNARCFYCHEKGIPKSNMSFDTAQKIIDYIELQKEKKIHIMWYGGEPLFNSGIIDFVSESLLKLNISFTCSMISNGILFDSTLSRKANSLWNLKDAQITIDGMGETYNKIKAYVYDNIKDPFCVVINNIESLLEEGVNIRIRLNIDEYNSEELFKLVDFLYEKFGKYSNFSVYSAPLFEECLGTSYKRKPDARKKIYRLHYELSEHIRSYNFLTKSSLPRVLRSQMRCIAVSNVRVVFPDGQLAFCHDYSEGVFSGNIMGREPSLDERLKYTEVIEDTDKCISCTKYPHCIRLKKCFDNKCDDESIDEWIWKTKNEMRWEYEK